jgi:hypothetical protein
MSSRPVNPRLKGLVRPSPIAGYQLTKWSIRNFKSVAQAEIPLRPLTVLLGPNSAGKSSLIQSILIFVQAQSAFERPDLVSLNGALVKLGAFDEVLHSGSASGRARAIELGGVLEEVVMPRSDASYARSRAHRAFGSAQPARMSWGTTFGQPSEAAPGRMQVNACWVQFDTPVGRSAAPHIAGGPHSGPSPGPGAPDSDPREVARIHLKRRSRRPTQPAEDLAIPVFSARRQTASVDADPAFMNWFHGSLLQPSRTRALRVAAGAPQSCLPAVAYRRLSLVKLLSTDPERLLEVGYLQDPFMLRRRRRNAAAHGGPGPHLEPLAAARESTDIVRQWWSGLTRGALRPDGAVETVRASVRNLAELVGLVVEVTERLASGRRAEFATLLEEQLAGSDVPETLLVEVSGNGAESEARDVVAHYLATSVHYLGPVRTTARAVASEAQYSRGVGVEGEITAAVLHGSWDRPTRYLRPASNGGLASGDEFAVEPLGQAVNEWMRALELGEVSTRDQARYGLEVTVRPPGLDVDLDLRNVGVGISQILPVVALCLRSAPGSLVMIEQPELHLHPAAQQRLADFLIAMMRSGRQLIVETHSDHMVARLRRRIAEDPRDALQEDIGFLYVTRDPESAATQYQEVEANIYGGLEDWPLGFFEQGPREAAEMIRTALEKKRARDPEGS